MHVSAGLHRDTLLLHLSLSLLLSLVDEVNNFRSRHPLANISQALGVLGGSWELVCHLQVHAKVCTNGWQADSAPCTHQMQCVQHLHASMRLNNMCLAACVHRKHL